MELCVLWALTICSKTFYHDNDISCQLLLRILSTDLRRETCCLYYIYYTRLLESEIDITGRNQVHQVKNPPRDFISSFCLLWFAHQQQWCWGSCSQIFLYSGPESPTPTAFSFSWENSMETSCINFMWLFEEYLG